MGLFKLLNHMMLTHNLYVSGVDNLFSNIKRKNNINEDINEDINNNNIFSYIYDEKNENVDVNKKILDLHNMLILLCIKGMKEYNKKEGKKKKKYNIL